MMSVLRHLLAWIAATACCALLVPVLWPAGAIFDRIEHWHQRLAQDPGAGEAARKLGACTLATHRQLAVLRTAWPDARVRPAGHTRRDAHPADAIADLACLRAVTFTAWLWVLGPFWFGAAVQGWVMRDIRRERFAARNPLIYRACLQGSIALSGSALLALVVPVDFPPAAIPVGGGLFAVLVLLAVVHRPSWGN